MAPSSNSVSQHLLVGYSGNRSSSAPPLTFSGASSAFIRTPEAPQYYQTINIHPLLEAQTISFNENLEAPEDITEMSNYSSSSSDYSYSFSTRDAAYGSDRVIVSQVSAF